MSIFDLNGPKKIVANEEIQITEENRYFFPGIIHGGENTSFRLMAGTLATDQRING